MVYNDTLAEHFKVVQLFSHKYKSDLNIKL